jgi:Zn-dependent protease with chaperone function
MRLTGLAFGTAALLLLCGCSNVADLGITMPSFDMSPGPPSEGRVMLASAVKESAARPAPTVTRTALGPGSNTLLVLLGENTIIQAPELANYARQIVGRLGRNWTGTVPDVRVFVTSDPLYGASATADGDILVTYGAFRNMESEAELAALLAHELSHVLLHHYDRDQTIGFQEQSLETAAKLSLLAAKLANTRIERVGTRFDVTERNNDKFQDRIMTVLISDMVTSELLSTLISPGWSRGQELWADALGLDLMVAAGYDPGGMSTMLERLRDSAGAMESRAEKLAEERGQMLNDAVLAGKFQDALDGMIKTGVELMAIGLQETRARMRALHDDADTRLAAIRDYIDREYPDFMEGKSGTLDWRRIADQDRVKRTLSNHELANQSMQALIGRDVNRGVGLASRAISYPTANAAYTRFAAFRAQQARGNLQRGVEELDQIGSGEFLSFQMQEKRIDSLLALGQASRADRILRNAEQQIGIPDVYLPSRISVSKAMDDPEAVKDAFGRCMQVSSDTLQEACRQRMGGKEAEGGSTLDLLKTLVPSGLPSTLRSLPAFRS